MITSHAITKKSTITSMAVLSIATALSMTVAYSFVHYFDKIVHWCTSFMLIAWSDNRMLAILGIFAISILLVSLLRSAHVLVTEWSQTRKLKKWFNTLRDHDAEKHLRLNIAFGGWIVKHEKPFALTFGILHPHIIISSKLRVVLNHSEISAVVRHEEHHVSRRDPIRRLAWALLRSFFFYLPLLDDVFEAQITKQEFLADYTMIQNQGTQRETIASGIKKIIQYQLEQPLFSSCLFASTRLRLAWLNSDTFREPVIFFRKKNILISSIAILLTIIVLTTAVRTAAHEHAYTAAANATYCQIAEANATSANQTKLPQGLIRINYSPLPL